MIYPNPFNESTIIAFKVPQNEVDADVLLKIFDMQGNEIRTLFNGRLLSRNYTLRWDGTDDNGNRISQGVYIYQLIINDKIYSGNIAISR